MQHRTTSFFEGLGEAIRTVACTDAAGAEMTREAAYDATLARALETTSRGGHIFFIGNGGSAGIASHMANDFSKNGAMPALCFNDGAALTCLGNDFGFEHVFAKQMEFHARRGDLLVAISSSGNSANILLAVEAARKIGCGVVTMSGFSAENKLRRLGDVNFHVGVKDYGLVEVAHTALIHAVVDLKMSLTGVAG